MKSANLAKEIKPIRLAVIGGGLNSAAGYSHFVSSQLDGLFKITCGYFSRDKEINTETSLKYGIEIQNRFTSLEELIKQSRSDFDAILILTPTPHHFEIVKKTIGLSIPTICEKPLANCYSEAEYIYKIIQKNLNKYDQVFLKKINLKYIVLCEKLSISGILTAGIPDHKMKTLIIDVKFDSKYFERVLHHEVFHIIND